MDDIDAAAAAFPDLQFEVVHGGFAFIEETAFQLARFPNIWGEPETTSNLAVAKPGAFERVMAGLIAHAGEGALDRIMWASGASVLHPEPPLRLVLGAVPVLAGNASTRGSPRDHRADQAKTSSG